MYSVWHEAAQCGSMGQHSAVAWGSTIWRHRAAQCDGVGHRVAYACALCLGRIPLVSWRIVLTAQLLCPAYGGAIVHAAWSVTQTQGCCNSRCLHFLAHSTPASASRSVIPYFNSALFSGLLWKAMGRSTPLSSICIRIPPSCFALQSVIMIIGF